MCHLGYNDVLHAITHPNISYGHTATIRKLYSDSNSITGYALNTSQGLLTLGMKLYAAHEICVVSNNYTNGKHCSMKQEAYNNNALKQ